MLPHAVDVEEELDEAARSVREELKAKYLQASRDMQPLPRSALLWLSPGLLAPFAPSPRPSPPPPRCTAVPQAEDLQQYAIAGNDDDFVNAVGGKAPASGGIVQVRSPTLSPQTPEPCAPTPLPVCSLSPSRLLSPASLSLSPRVH